MHGIYIWAGRIFVHFNSLIKLLVLLSRQWFYALNATYTLVWSFFAWISMSVIWFVRLICFPLLQGGGFPSSLHLRRWMTYHAMRATYAVTLVCLSWRTLLTQFYIHTNIEVMRQLLKSCFYEVRFEFWWPSGSTEYLNQRAILGAVIERTMTMFAYFFDVTTGMAEAVCP